MNSQTSGAQDILSAALGQSGLSFELLDDNSPNIYDNGSITAVPEQSSPCSTSAAIPLSDLDQLLGIVSDRKSVSQNLSSDTSAAQGGSGVMYKNYSVMVNSALRSNMTFNVPKEDDIIELLAPSISQQEPKSGDFKDTGLEILLRGAGNDGFECNSVKSFAESVLQVGGEGLNARTERQTDIRDPALQLDRGNTKTSASPTPSTLPLVPRSVVEQKGEEAGRGSSQGSIEKFEEEDEDYEELGHSDTYSEYMPAKCKIGAKHPDPVVETSSMSSVHAPDIWYRLSLPSEVIVNRYLSALQLEAIIYACQQHEKLLPIGKRAGYFIGDGAGVGKGRTVAGIIYENYLLGRKKAIWLSVSNDLKYDAVRDLRDIGCHIPVHSLNKFKYDEKISSKANGKVKKGVIFATYSSLIGETQGRTMFRTRLSQLLQWCKEDFDGVLIFDECHKAKNLVPSGSSKPTKTGLTVLQLQDCLPKARVVYCSATGASEPRNMAYMNRLGIWGYGTAFPDFNSFLQSVEKRGVGAMEMVAMDMKLRGMYMARQLSFAGVNFDIQEVSLNKSFIEMYNASAKLWTETRDRFEQAASLVELDGKSRKTMWGQFWSAHQRFFKYLCIASKVKKVVEIAREALECGKCVVIGLQTTGEAQMLEQLDEFRGEVTDFISTARGVYSGLVEKHFPSPGAVKFNEPVYDDDEEPLFPDSPQVDRKRKRAWKSEYQSKHKKPKDVGLFVDDGRVADSSDSDTDIDQILNGSDLSSNSGASSGSDSDEDDWLKALSSKPKVRKKTLEKKESIHSTEDSNSMNVFAAAGLNLGKQFLWATSDTANQLKSNRIGKASQPSGLVEKMSFVSRQHAPVKGSMVEMISSIKQELMEKFEIVSPYLPANTLDELIDELGGTENVAEMTGRKGRIVCKEDGSFTYEPRCKDDVPLELLNIAEKKRFMEGEKLIAVISEAASSGVSLQADRRARNQRRRIHITLELPWSADKAIQQFGRTHRSNQVSAPEYLFLISELAGERRFSSVVAKRLESLGALTHGDRRATESRDLSRYNIDTKYGRIALESVLRAIAGQEKSTVPFPVDYPGNFLQDCRAGLVGVGLILKDPSSGQHLLPEKDHSNIARFLNRILGLTVELQNSLFTYFMDTLNELIREAKRSGRWDEGILDMGSQGEMVKKLNVRTFLCPSTCGEVTAELITVAVERGLPWEKAFHLCSSSVATEEGFYMSHQIKSNKRTAILVKRHGGTSRRRTYSVFKPNVGLQPKPELLEEIQKRFTKVMPDVAEPVWKEQFLFAEHNCIHSYWRGNCKKKYVGLSCEVGMRNRTCHILSGSVLSVWSKVESVLMTQPGPQGKIQIIRVKLDDGGKVVGALIPSNCVSTLVNALSTISVNKDVF